MQVASELMKQLDPRVSYDRGPWVAPELVNAEGVRVQPVPQAENTSANPRAALQVDPGLAAIPTEDLLRELQKREKYLAKLQARRVAIRAEIADLEREITRLSDEVQEAPRRAAPVRAQRGQRFKNSLSLPQAMVAELETGEHTTPPELAKRILRSGYLTNASDFPKIVAQALARDKRFRRVGRGEYELLV
ncbi:MAG: hypothetical protein ACT4PU_00480 [Planctomycetota bacterium]